MLAPECKISSRAFKLLLYAAKWTHVSPRGWEFYDYIICLIAEQQSSQHTIVISQLKAVRAKECLVRSHQKVTQNVRQ